MALDRMQQLSELAQKADPLKAGGGTSAAQGARTNTEFGGIFAKESTFIPGNDAENIFAAASAGGSSSSSVDNLLSNYESQMNSMLNSAMRQAKTQMTISTIGQVAGTLGTLFGGASSASGSLFNLGNIFSGSAANPAAASAPADSACLGMTSDLTTAISNYSSKGSNENWTALNNEIEKAKNDRATLTQVVADSDAKVRQFTAEKPALEQAIKDTKAEVNAAQKAVDDNKIGVQAEIRVNAIEKTEIPAQEKIVEDSKKRVSDAQGTYNTDKADAESKMSAAQNKINSNKEMASKTPQPTKDANGNITGYNPTQEQVNTAKRLLAEGEQELKAAQEKLKQAEETYKSVLRAELGIDDINASIPTNPTAGRQGAALSTIANLEEEKKEKQQIVEQNGGKDAVEKLIAARQAAGDKLETAQSALEKATKEKDEAVQKSGQASAQIRTLDKQISEAEKLMSKKQK